MKIKINRVVPIRTDLWLFDTEFLGVYWLFLIWPTRRGQLLSDSEESSVKLKSHSTLNIEAIKLTGIPLEKNEGSGTLSFISPLIFLLFLCTTKRSISFSNFYLLIKNQYASNISHRSRWILDVFSSPRMHCSVWLLPPSS